ncbi:hypothetical protein [Streptomyces sp. NPDC097619]|uniref:hypothetical protein n=1 Tax=Streptomyces sp. NPDC097619 TaxID=3157228 RepID=UPI00332A7C83
MTQQTRDQTGADSEAGTAAGTAPAPDTAPAVPDAPPVPNLTPAVPDAAPAAPAPRRDRRVLRAVLRWTAAVLVFAGAGAGTAYTLAERERTELPGLATLDDGRWTYPRLVRPPLPAGAPLPFHEDNTAGIHYADLGALLLPAPEGSVPERLEAARAETGGPDTPEAVTTDQYLKEYAAEDRSEIRQELTDSGLRGIAGRAWTMPDGTRTRVYLLRFPAQGFSAAYSRCARQMNLHRTAPLELDLPWSAVKDEQDHVLRGTGTEVGVYIESEPAGAERTRAACVRSGDVQALVVQSRKGTLPAVPFHQTVVLQNQLLG